MPDPHDEPNLPESLQNELSQLYRADVQPSAEVDQSILNHARAYMARRRRWRFALDVSIAAAAILLITAIILPTMSTDQGHRHHVSNSSDVNGDGVVDIRDALALQRSIDAGATGGVDINHDGRTDRRDVDAIAMLAVRIDVGASGGAVR